MPAEGSQRIQVVAIVRCGRVAGELTGYQTGRDCSVNLRPAGWVICRHEYVWQSRPDDGRAL